MRVFGSRRYGFVPGPAAGGHRDDLLVWLHGSTQSATVTRRFTNRRFEHLGMSVAYPEGVARHWNDGRRLLQEKTRELGTNDVEYLTEFVHSFECTGRVFGAGFSNGGHMIYRLLHEAPGLFDAALVIAATQPTPENFLPTPPTANRWRPTPLLLIHGESDPIAPMAGGTVRGSTQSAQATADYYRRLNGDAAPVRLVTLPNTGHVVPGPGCVTSEFLGPANESVDAAKLFGQFIDELPR